jgi:hypothetical protein
MKEDTVERERVNKSTKEGLVKGKEWTQIQEECLWDDSEEWRSLCHMREKSGHRYKRSAYGMTEKNGEGFVIRGKEWTQIQEECLWEDTEEWRRFCYKRERVDIYNRSAYGKIQKNGEGFVIIGNEWTHTRGVLMGGQRRMEKALL